MTKEKIIETLDLWIEFEIMQIDKYINIKNKDAPVLYMEREYHRGKMEAFQKVKLLLNNKH